jgi:hypothetical protein
VLKAGPKFELLGTNRLGQLLMATPAITGGMMFVRAERDLLRHRQIIAVCAYFETQPQGSIAQPAFAGFAA